MISCNTSKDINNDLLNGKPGILNEKLSDGLQQGAIDIFKQSVKTESSDKNVIISPLSIQYAVGMAANGASGNTLDEIMKIFGTSSDKLQEVNSNLKAIKEKVAGNSKDYTLGIANAVFYDASKYQMAGNYENILNADYAAKLQQLNFGNVSESLKNINNWVAANTEQRIQKVLEEIQDNEFMFLINALYMKASWDKPFVAEATRNIDFKDSKELTHVVSLMNQRDNISYYKTEDEKAIVLPMAGNKLEAIFILPQKLNVIDYISTINNEGIKKISSSAKVQDLMIGLPKTELSLKYDLKPILENMGVKTAFTQQADFTKMGVASNKILLTRALHDVFFKMDEKGIEGAAVTTIGVGVTSMPEYVEFNKPFVMIIKDTATGTYLFMGKVEKP